MLINSEAVTVGHLPKFMSKTGILFCLVIRCEIAGSKKYSSDLVQDGLEIPAKKIFPNSKERINAEMKKKFAPLIEEFDKNIKCYKYM